MIEPSKFQRAIFDFIEQRKESLVIEAVAGSGKTTTIVNVLERIDPENRTLFVAFNKAIADELAKKVPKHVEAKTTHSVAWGVARRVYDKAKVDGNKFTRVFKEVLAETDKSDEEKNLLKTVYYEGVRRMVGLARNFALGPAEFANKEILLDTPSEYLKIIEDYDIDFDEDANRIVSDDGGDSRANEEAMEARINALAVDLAQKCLRKSIEISHEVVDFDDMLYLPILHGMRFYTYHYVFCDESQDLNRIQFLILRRLLAPNGRLIAVGDSRQAIYLFRGSDSSSMAKIKQNFKAEELPLSICYRCPTSVVKIAQHDVPWIEASPSAPEGIVRSYRGYDHTVFKPADLIVCRNNGPLVSLAFGLLGKGVAVKIRGRDIAKGLIKIIEKQKADDLDDLEEKLSDWRDKEFSKAMKKGQESKADAVDDKYNVIKIFMDSPHVQTINHLIQRIEAMYQDDSDENMVNLSTVHKAKGLEADRVFILEPKLLEGKRAKKPEAIQQERNIRYVAVTRAKKELSYIELNDFEKQIREVPYGF